MRKSQKVFKERNTKRYIHRVLKTKTDTGIEFPMLRQMVFVQLDKALEEFINGTYINDEDRNLLELLAMIADVNNPKVQHSVTNNKMLKEICQEVSIFSKDKEVQAMLLAEELAVADWNSNSTFQKKEGRMELLYELVRDGDMTVQKAAKKANVTVEDFERNMTLLGYK